jgi:hypothetical protein
MPAGQLRSRNLAARTVDGFDADGRHDVQRRLQSGAFLLLIPLLAACAGAQAVPLDEPDVVAGGVAFSADSVDGKTVASPGGTISLGQVVAIQDAELPWADISIVEVQQDQGSVFLSVRVRYLARTDGVDYSPLSFRAFVEGQAVAARASSLDAPRPALLSGTLQAGHAVEGWLTYEVPATGRVTLGYGGNAFRDEDPLFEVVLRAS